MPDKDVKRVYEGTIQKELKIMIHSWLGLGVKKIKYSVQFIIYWRPMMIEVKGLKKSFQDNQVLKHIDMKVDAGKIYGLIGSNGCGKTTILKHILSIYTPDAGRIIINGEPIEDISNNLDIYFVQDELYFPELYPR